MTITKCCEVYTVIQIVIYLPLLTFYLISTYVLNAMSIQ